MLNELSNEQIVRVFELCEKVFAIQRQVPPIPLASANRQAVQLETARALREVLGQHNELLMELGALLR